MDGQTYVKSKMRSLKPYKKTSQQKRKNNLISSKKNSNILQSKKFLIELLQLIFFSSTSILLIFTFSDQAWRPISFEQTKINGLSGITKKDIKENTSSFFFKEFVGNKSKRD